MGRLKKVMLADHDEFKANESSIICSYIMPKKNMDVNIRRRHEKKILCSKIVLKLQEPALFIVHLD